MPDGHHNVTDEMPEYYFSVGLELLQDPELSSEHSPNPGDCSAVSQTLAPFARATPHKRIHKLGSLETPSVSGSARPRSSGTPPTSHAHHDSPLRAVPSSLADKRLDKISIESIDMIRGGQKDERPTIAAASEKNNISKGIGSAISGLQTKGSYTPLDHQTTGSVWGIVHLYRDAEETPGLYGDSPLSKPSDPWLHGFTRDSTGPKHSPPADQDCTTLCVLAVPSYMGPSDFLGFAGEQTWNEVSHFRMIKTARANKYMVLMKFRNGKKAREWQQEWNGKVFNGMEVSS
jgi:BRCA1-associated protein